MDKSKQRVTKSRFRRKQIKHIYLKKQPLVSNILFSLYIILRFYHILKYSNQVEKAFKKHYTFNYHFLFHYKKYNGFF